MAKYVSAHANQYLSVVQRTKSFALQIVAMYDRTTHELYTCARAFRSREEKKVN